MKIDNTINVNMDGKLMSAEVLSTIEKENDKFLVYSVDKNGESNLYVSKIVEENDSFRLEDTNDREVEDYVLKLISNKVKSISTSDKKMSKKEDIINEYSIESTKVTEKNMEDAISIMKEWSENN